MPSPPTKMHSSSVIRRDFGLAFGSTVLSVPRRSRTLGRQRLRRPAARRNERSISWCFPSFAAAAAAAILVTWRRYLSCDKISVAFRRWLVNSGAALAAEICRLRSKNRPGSDAPGADSENCREMLAFFALL